MNTTVAGLMTGLALGFAGYFGGFGALIVVAVVGLAGLIVGWLARGDLRLPDSWRRRADERRQGATTPPRSAFRQGGGRRETGDARGRVIGTQPRTDHRVRVQ